MMNKNQIINGKCIDYTYDGLGVVKTDTFCLFVKDMIKGEQGDIIVTAVKKDYGYGKLLKLTEASDQRVEPVCPLSRICGGCQLLHCSYQHQLQFKRDSVQKAINRIGHLDITVDDIIGTSQPYRYRNKIMLPVGKDADGKCITGFYRFNSHQIIAMDECYLQSERANDIVRTIRSLIDEFDLADSIRHLMIREMIRTDQIMVVFVTYQKSVAGLDRLAARLAEKYPSITSIMQNVNGEDTNVVLGKQDIRLYGSQHVYDMLCGLKFKVSVHSFYQVNTTQTEVLYGKAVELAGLDGSQKVLDLYSGVGTIGMIASRKAASVTSVEIVEQAVRDARENAAINGIENMEFICDDARKAADEFSRQGRHFDVIFIDPPRKGCSREAIDILRQLKPERIVYVSCNPSTLARDLDLLKEDFSVEKIIPVDMFAGTYHVETVCCLYHQKKDFISVPYEPKDADYLKQLK